MLTVFCCVNLFSFIKFQYQIRSKAEPFLPCKWLKEGGGREREEEGERMEGGEGGRQTRREGYGGGREGGREEGGSGS